MNRRAALAAVAVPEKVLTLAMAAVVTVMVVTGVVSLRRDGLASEPLGVALADQQRVLDALTLDLRRAIVPGRMDADEEGMRLVLPDLYRFDPGDPQHLHPIANEHPNRDPATAPTVTYHYFNGAVTRADPWQPLVRDAQGGYVDSGPVTISASVDDFPTVLPDPPDGTGGAPGCYRVTFHSPVRPLAATNGTRVIVLAR